MSATSHILHRRDGESGLVASKIAVCTGIRTVIKLDMSKKPQLALTVSVSSVIFCPMYP
jgi:hypothetical protein